MGSLEEGVLARYVIIRYLDHSQFDVNNLVATNIKASTLYADLPGGRIKLLGVAVWSVINCMIYALLSLTCIARHIQDCLTKATNGLFAPLRCKWRRR